MIRKKVLIFYSFLFLKLVVFAQSGDIKKFDKNNWDIRSKIFKIKTFKGKESLYLENGIALIKNDSLKNGVIDFYVTFTNTRKFVSFYFRSQDSLTYERFYMRPHAAGNKDATQYTPVFNGLSAWQLYYDGGYTQPYYFNFNEWNHIRFVINNKEMDVYINDMSMPVLETYDLKHEVVKGGMGIGVSRGGAYFADFSYKKIENPNIFNTSKITPKEESGTIKEWQVSSPFGESLIKDVYDLKNFKKKKSLKWQKLKSEYSGTLNLAQITSVSDSTNTVLVKLIINSDKKQIKKLDYGYNDIAKIFLNSKIIHSGSRTFRSRDYKYLGTIGYFNSVYLDLKKGKNELFFAVSETFGGWGIKAKFKNLNGLQLK